MPLPAPGQTRPSSYPLEHLARDIATWALGQMAYYKVPGWIGFVDALPRTPTEKILRAALKEEVGAHMARGAFFDTRALKRRQG